MKILMIDDDRGKMYSVTNCLEEFNFKIVSIYPKDFDDGSRWKSYDIVVLDYDMSPSGLEIAPVIRRNNPRVVIIGYSMLWRSNSLVKKLVDYCINDSNELAWTIRSLHRFLASELNEQQAKNRLIDRIIKIYREVDSNFGDKVDQDILVKSIDPSVDDDDLPTDVVYYINQGIRVWKNDDLEIMIL